MWMIQLQGSLDLVNKLPLILCAIQGDYGRSRNETEEVEFELAQVNSKVKVFHCSYQGFAVY